MGQGCFCREPERRQLPQPVPLYACGPTSYFSAHRKKLIAARLEAFKQFSVNLWVIKKLTSNGVCTFHQPVRLLHYLPISQVTRSGSK